MSESEKEKDLKKIDYLLKHLMAALKEGCEKEDCETEIIIHAVTSLFTYSCITYFGKEKTVGVLQELIKNMDIL